MTFLTFLFVLGVLIIVHEFGHFIIARRNGVRVERFSVGFGKKLIVKKRGETEYTVSAVPLGGYVKLAGDSEQEYKGESYEYMSKPPGKRAQIICAGPFLNYITGIVFFCFIFFFGYPTLTTQVGEVLEGYGAQEAGLEKGDTIVAIAGTPVATWEDMQQIIHNTPAPAVLEVALRRGAQELTLPVAIKEKKVGDLLGEEKKIGLIGIAPSDEIIYIKHGPVESLRLGAQKAFDLTVLTYKALGRMITGKMSFKDSVTGPLGIFYITSEATRMGIIALLHLMAVLSISLAIFNLLPLPILDGGHVVLLGIEKVRGKRLTANLERIITQVGFFFLISLAIFITYNDFMRFFGDTLAAFFSG